MGNGRTIWFPIEKGEHEEATILSLLYWKDTRIFLDFLYFPRQWLNGTIFRKKLLPVNFSLFLKVQHSAIFNYQFILVFIHSFSFYCHLLFLSVLELAWCPSWMLPTKRYLDLHLNLEDILLLHIALIKEAVDGSRNKLRVKTSAI